MPLRAEEKEDGLKWAIKTAQANYPGEGWDRPLKWAERNGYVKGAIYRRQAWEQAQAGNFEKALEILES